MENSPPGTQTIPAGANTDGLPGFSRVATIVSAEKNNGAALHSTKTPNRPQCPRWIPRYRVLKMIASIFIIEF
jgi:hypothetical protein